MPSLRAYLDPLDADGAYAVQEIKTKAWQAEGRRIVGREAGLTAKAVQAQLGVDQPDFGLLFEDMAVEDGGHLDPARAIQPKAGAGIAFVLGADLPSSDTTPDQVAAADYGLDTRSILAEVGRRKMVGGQEDMISDVALDLVAGRGNP